MARFGYCVEQIEGQKKCKVQCEHCALYYAPLEKVLSIERQIGQIDKQITKGLAALVELTEEKQLLKAELEKL